jgi:hypothetical protein
MLVQCDECQSSMSDVAESCPACGWVPGRREAIAEARRAQRWQAHQREREAKRRRLTRWLVWGGLALASAVVVIGKALGQ